MDTLTGWSSDYYKLPENAEELQDLIEFKDMNFAVGNIFKAAYRLGSKDGTTMVYDLEKIMWFAQRELKRINPPPKATVEAQMTFNYDLGNRLVDQLNEDYPTNHKPWPDDK
jgi:hypothetical protein